MPNFDLVWQFSETACEASQVAQGVTLSDQLGDFCYVEHWHVAEIDGGYRYDACQRERTGRGTGGALVGARPVVG